MNSNATFYISTDRKRKIFRVAGPFREKETLKAIVGAKWESGLKAWTYPMSRAAAGYLAEGLEGRFQADEHFWILQDKTVELSLGFHCQTPPWGHQLEAMTLAWDLPGTMLAMDMGTGKSKVAVDLFVNHHDKLGLVLCPKSVVPVWPREFRLHGPSDIDVWALNHKGVIRKTDEMYQKIALSKAKGRACVIVMNHDSAWRKPMAKALLEIGWDSIYWDESHRGKAADAQMGLFMQQLHWCAKRRYCLTGTPMPHSPLDIFNQYRFLDPGIFGPYYGAFKARHDLTSNQAQSNPIRVYRNGLKMSQEALAMQVDAPLKMIRLWELGKLPVWPQKMTPLSQGLQQPPAKFEQEYLDWRIAMDAKGGVANEEILTKAFYSIAYRVKAEDCQDLPELQMIAIPCPLEPKPRKIYDELEEELYTKIASGECSVSNALAQSIRLRQVCSGHIRDNEDILHVVSDHKESALRDILESVDEPVAVFCPFRPDLEIVKKIALELELAYGEVSGRQNDLDDDAHMPEWCEVMGVMIQSGSVGVDLTLAALGIVFAPDWSLANWLQMIKRLHRPGQNRKTRFITLVTENSIEEKVYKALERREEVVEAILLEIVDDDRSKRVA